MQLVAYGARIYLTGNPQITFFKVGTKIKFNFSMEAIDKTINGKSWFSMPDSIISRNGDLTRIYLFN